MVAPYVVPWSIEPSNTHAIFSEQVSLLETLENANMAIAMTNRLHGPFIKQHVALSLGAHCRRQARAFGAPLRGFGLDRSVRPSAGLSMPLRPKPAKAVRQVALKRLR
jgi:hypothetical protein